MSTLHINLYVGNDEFEIYKKADQFRSKFTDPTAAEMNTARLDARFVSESDLSNAIGAVPFLSDERLVVLENVSRGYPGLSGHKKFLAILDKIPSSTRLVILDAGEIKPQDLSNHWLAKWAAGHAGEAEFKALMMPRQVEMPAWIRAEAKRQGGSIEPQAAGVLAEMTGENTRQAAMEITKLLTYVNYAHAIGLEDVNAVSIFTAGVNVFELAEAIGNQEGARALKLFHQWLEEKDAREIFGLIIRQFRLLLLTRELLDNGGSAQEVGELLKIQYNQFIQKYIHQAEKFRFESLDKIYHRLVAMDDDSKTGGMPLEAALDILIVELAGQVYA